ncbi:MULTISPECIES: protease modulator HflK [unclassified Novosphingobium]|uniref:protease modulator HflK n=1 Tax=unclassified Novosphingobium TaxID=2644732 RepID=UPI0006C89E65|nr:MULTISPECIES: protease modulator HflK [unclassified Novosphingobium]KPH60698.1 peptidase [Novosphingobium sp. ST904]MPS67898.1 protease modulator HflK [Novosphingobium sp.]TCM39314.1 membrane protease subunit HflK [Novosphingobium sp. ST904]
MTGRQSPWGGGGNDGNGPAGEPGEGGNEGVPEGQDEGRNDEPSGEAPGSRGEQGKPPESRPDDRKGPRNPWLPSGSETPPRRAAGIEDIFRPRDPRRPGGGGGGFGPGGGFPNLPRRPDGKSWLPLGIGIAVAAMLGISMVHMLGPKEQGIVSRLGQYSRTIDSGLSLTLPWPIEQVDVKDVRSFTVYTIPEGEGEKLMLTGDKNLVDLSYLVRWNIKNLKDYTYRLADPDETVREVAEAAMRASIGQITLNETLSGAGRAVVEQDVRDRTQRILDYYRSGVSIQGVEIKKADPPAKTKEAFDQVNVSQQEADRDRSKARAWAQQTLARAQGEAASFDKVYEQYKLAPEVTKRRMYYETMERVLRDNDTVVAEAKNMNTYLPLSEMKRRAPAAEETVVAAPAPAATVDASKGGQ